MNKPEKKKDHDECCPFRVGDHCGCGFEEHNQACDDWEKYHAKAIHDFKNSA